MASLLRTTVDGREYGVRHIAQYFDYDHLPPDLQAISEIFHDLAVVLVRSVKDSPELTVALRKLLESKDAAVRAAVSSRGESAGLNVERCPVYGQHPGHRWHHGNPHGALYQVEGDAQIVWCRGEPKQ